MTRINCIPVQKLSRQHLVAEYREMLRLRNLYPRKVANPTPSYRMGRGHVLFFLDKGAWLQRRHEQLRDEMARRGYTSNYKLDLSHWPDDAMLDWFPDIDARLANVARLINRMV